jgi:hypothetical protein
LIFLFPLRLHAQGYPSGISSVALSASVDESLTLTVPVGAVDFGTLIPGGPPAAGSPSVPITTSWVLKPNRGNVTLMGYFDTTDALTDIGPPAAHITTSQVLGKVTGAGPGSPTTFTAFTGGPVDTVGTAVASLQLFREPISGTNKVKSRTDTLDLEINADAQQPAGTYTGTLRIRAIAL